MIKGNKLIEGTVTVSGDKVLVRQGSLDRPFPKADVLYVGETKDDVYRFMLARVPANDANTRMAVARWCMFSGMREQALTEAREILKIQPADKTAMELARSLEQSLKDFSADGASRTKQAGALVTVVEPDPDVTAEGATTFATRAQTVLANQCMECHARGDHGSAFKLIRVTGFEVGPQSTHTNLRAVAAQLKKDDPANSPLLTKSLIAHGGMKQPAFVSRQAVAFRALEAWVMLAVTPSVPPMTPPTQPLIAPKPPVTPIPPATASTVPSLSPNVPAPSQTAPALPPVEPPAAILPAAPTAVPPVLPTPSSIPLAEPTTRTPSPVDIPVIPTIPSPTSLPKPPDIVKPASSAGSQFGTGTKPVVPAGPANDEFDPAGFNRSVQPPK